jgi:hypothetical protein
MEQDAAPAGGRRTLLPHSGGPGQPSDPTMRVCLRWLDVTRTMAGESWPGRVGLKPPVAASGSTAPGSEIAAVARREAPHLGNKVRT